MHHSQRLATAGRRPHGVGHVLRQFHHLQSAGALLQPLDEAALFQRCDQPVDAGLGFQVQRILHLVEGGRNARLPDALMDEHEQFVLLLGQHLKVLRAPETKAQQCRNVLIWFAERVKYEFYRVQAPATCASALARCHSRTNSQAVNQAAGLALMAITVSAVGGSNSWLSANPAAA
jgi:hypothetical protein